MQGQRMMKFFLLPLVLAALELEQTASTSLPDRQSSSVPLSSRTNQLLTSGDVTTSADDLDITGGYHAAAGDPANVNDLTSDEHGRRHLYPGEGESFEEFLRSYPGEDDDSESAAERTTRGYFNEPREINEDNLRPTEKSSSSVHFPQHHGPTYIQERGSISDITGFGLPRDESRSRSHGSKLARDGDGGVTNNDDRISTYNNGRSDTYNKDGGTVFNRESDVGQSRDGDGDSGFMGDEMHQSLMAKILDASAHAFDGADQHGRFEFGPSSEGSGAKGTEAAPSYKPVYEAPSRQPDPRPHAGLRPAPLQSDDESDYILNGVDDSRQGGSEYRDDKAHESQQSYGGQETDQGQDYRHQGDNQGGEDHRGQDYIGDEYRGEGYGGEDLRGEDYRGDGYRADDSTGGHRGNGHEGGDYQGGDYRNGDYGAEEDRRGGGYGSEESRRGGYAAFDPYKEAAQEEEAYRAVEGETDRYGQYSRSQGGTRHPDRKHSTPYPSRYEESAMDRGYKGNGGYDGYQRDHHSQPEQELNNGGSGYHGNRDNKRSSRHGNSDNELSGYYGNRDNEQSGYSSNSGNERSGDEGNREGRIGNANHAPFVPITRSPHQVSKRSLAYLSPQLGTSHSLENTTKNTDADEQQDTAKPAAYSSHKDLASNFGDNKLSKDTAVTSGDPVTSGDLLPARSRHQAVYQPHYAGYGRQQGRQNAASEQDPYERYLPREDENDPYFRYAPRESIQHSHDQEQASRTGEKNHAQFDIYGTPRKTRHQRRPQLQEDYADYDEENYHKGKRQNSNYPSYDDYEEDYASPSTRNSNKKHYPDYDYDQRDSGYYSNSHRGNRHGSGQRYQDDERSQDYENDLAEDDENDLVKDYEDNQEEDYEDNPRQEEYEDRNRRRGQQKKRYRNRPSSAYYSGQHQDEAEEKQDGVGGEDLRHTYRDQRRRYRNGRPTSHKYIDEEDPQRAFEDTHDTSGVFEDTRDASGAHEDNSRRAAGGFEDTREAVSGMLFDMAQKKKDSSCKEIKRDGMSCLQCSDANGMQTEECAYAGEVPGSGHSGYSTSSSYGDPPGRQDGNMGV